MSRVIVLVLVAHAAGYVRQAVGAVCQQRPVQVVPESLGHVDVTEALSLAARHNVYWPAGYLSEQPVSVIDVVGGGDSARNRPRCRQF